MNPPIITYRCRQSCANAVLKMNNSICDGRKISVELTTNEDNGDLPFSRLKNGMDVCETNAGKSVITKGLYSDRIQSSQAASSTSRSDSGLAGRAEIRNTQERKGGLYSDIKDPLRARIVKNISKQSRASTFSIAVRNAIKDRQG